ncbi:MAG: hypothetical protein A2487_12710 [Candidatus Raymondbacteria bacterium RifOxyC12_full_50_8]|uniref:Thioredoxin domain-containing protein n=1 Tax=Candidatus Raymondbacteria bacterium RIFOXYD12_FULL_49_13 TaxID=1817890 RepID=A0A1F7FCB9_UNCRA|nr:MAG: hypothetical protein A2248_03050 [Candidatus Raymondbacteria bacterium RIFOXYA2_FULL_49_16]OGJ93457.1 MAG: hypothetical protein A2350_18970 [Candidatus Raymondbacteria bacterium RifOxyB12_full_50_8]OGK04283.1 MAG: hypothetical protein A2519_18155 [Candidatus Raymondbacteria bacterium RIFOXYD12_FULL_49_13]OGK07979.1 MAG: hypothetical protein A2487_12710 [Candidatus Raymondbacteria bacterium RifOxyC12_full_50_8]OGP42433.1 MAG: hypothetical protein A2324_17085 [Candidatus Raymondbacteria b
MKIFICIVLAVAAGFGHAGDLSWNNFTDGYAKIKGQKKAGIIDFYTDWCHWCKVMDQKTFNDPEVKKKLMGRFVSIRINPETSKEVITYQGKVYTPMEFAGALGVRGFPAIAFINKKGDFITMLPGYIPPETFINILSYVDDECYEKQVSFDDYMKKTGTCQDAKAVPGKTKKTGSKAKNP